MSEQVEKIKKLIKTATNPKQKAMYQELLAKLQASSNTQAIEKTESKPQTALTQKPKRQISKSKSKSKPPEPTEPEQVETEVKPTSEKGDLETQSVESSPETVNQTVKSESSQIPTEESIESTPEPHTSESDPEKSPSEITADSSEPSDESQSESEEPENQAYFQGIGIIKGKVTLTDERSTVKIENKEYRLYYIPGKKKKAYDALAKEIETTGNDTLRLIVYPKVLHLPKKEQPHRVGFQVVGFIGSQSKPTALNDELKDGEFKLSGLWQFIPVCRVPCISIFRNFNKERLAWIKETEAHRKVKFMKASHIPVLWKDSPVKPFRFNPKLEKEQQGQTYFVQIKVKFIPSRDVFGFAEQLDEPTEDTPGFLKASKKLKAEALKEAKEHKQRQSEGEQPKQLTEQPKQSEESRENQSTPPKPKKPKSKKQKQSEAEQPNQSEVQETVKSEDSANETDPK
ncbi:MAG: hypothetical protein AAFO04_29480 [Cyanobacteria bacterium J06592_8]